MPLDERHPSIDPGVQWDAWPLDHFEQADSDDKIITVPDARHDSRIRQLLDAAPMEGRSALIAWSFTWGLVLEEVCPITDLEHRVEISRLGFDWRELYEQSFDVLVTFDPLIEDADEQIRWFRQVTLGVEALADSTFYADAHFEPDDPDLFVYTGERSAVLCDVLSFGVSGVKKGVQHTNRDAVFAWLERRFSPFLQQFQFAPGSRGAQ